ncbi:MAG: TonB-dependent receptor, partial [Gammaproteobacteria bacterium]|nr:TonB-dependent receptor [Gammaproteobacteria bacterium]
IIDVDATTVDYLAKVKNIQDFSQGVLTSGLDLTQQNIKYVVTGKRQPCNNEFEVCPPSYFAPVETETEDLDINFVTAFADFDWDIIESWIFKLGVSANQNDFNDQQFLEPRVAVKWSFTDDYQLKVAYGQHHQWFRKYQYLSDTFGAPDLELARSEHYVFGLEYEGASDWAWRLETYYKEMFDLIVANPAAQTDSLNDSAAAQDNYLNEGTGKAYGIEFLVNKAISENWYGWLSIAYSKTERVNEITDESFNYQFDLPWIVNLVANYEINDKWQLGGRWRLQSGSLYTPITGAAPVYVEGQDEPLFYDPIEGEFNSQRLEEFHRLDVRLDYKTEWFGYDTDVYFEVLNLYGQQSLEGYDYNEDYTEREEEYQFPSSPIPSIGVKMVF